MIINFNAIKENLINEKTFPIGSIIFTDENNMYITKSDGSNKKFSDIIFVDDINDPTINKFSNKLYFNKKNNKVYVFDELTNEFFAITRSISNQIINLNSNEEISVNHEKGDILYKASKFISNENILDNDRMDLINPDKIITSDNIGKNAVISTIFENDYNDYEIHNNNLFPNNYKIDGFLYNVNNEFEKKRGLYFYNNYFIPDSNIIENFNKGNIIKIASNIYSIYFLTNDNTVYSCGYNNYGQLGLGDTVNRYIPTLIPNLTNIKEIICNDNYSIYFLTNDNTVYSCGYNANGQLGLGDNNERNIPTLIPNLTNIKEIICNDNYSTYFLTNDNLVYSCGYNANGQLGLGDTNTRYTPTLIPYLTNIKEISCNNNSVYFLTNNNTVYSCGYNGYGELGLGDTNTRYTPTLIPYLTNIKEISCNNNSVYFLTNNNTVYSCGYNVDGELGLGDTNNRNTPTLIPNLNNIKEINCSNYSVYFLTNDGLVYSYGYNGYGQLGLGDSTSNHYIPNLTNVKEVISNNYSTYFLTEDNLVYSCGRNDCGKLGLGDTNSRNTPTLIPYLTNIKDISCINSSYFLTNDNKVYSCGYNNYGQLGLGDINNRYIPTLIKNKIENYFYINYNTKDNFLLNFLLIKNSNIYSTFTNNKLFIFYNENNKEIFSIKLKNDYKFYFSYNNQDYILGGFNSNTDNRQNITIYKENNNIYFSNLDGIKNFTLPIINNLIIPDENIIKIKFNNYFYIDNHTAINKLDSLFFYKSKNPIYMTEYTFNKENYYNIATTDLNNFQIEENKINIINYLNIDHSLNNGLISILISFDNKKNWLYYDIENSKFNKIDFDPMVSNVKWLNSNTIEEIENVLKNLPINLLEYNLKNLEIEKVTSIDLAFQLYSNDDNITPYIGNITLDYSQSYKEIPINYFSSNNINTYFNINFNEDINYLFNSKEIKLENNTAKLNIENNPNLLMHFNNNDNKFSDEVNNKLFTTNGNPIIDNLENNYKLGDGSLYLNGTSSLSSNSILFDSIINNTNKWSIEFWLRVDTNNLLSSNMTIFELNNLDDTNSQDKIKISINSGINSNRISFYSLKDNEENSILSSNTDIYNNNWYYYVFQSDSNKLYLYIDGELDNSVDYSSMINFNQALYIGKSHLADTENYFKGWIDELQILIGKVKYSSNFTIPEQETEVIRLNKPYNIITNNSSKMLLENLISIESLNMPLNIPENTSIKILFSLDDKIHWLYKDETGIHIYSGNLEEEWTNSNTNEELISYFKNITYEQLVFDCKNLNIQCDYLDFAFQLITNENYKTPIIQPININYTINIEELSIKNFDDIIYLKNVTHKKLVIKLDIIS